MKVSELIEWLQLQPDQSARIYFAVPGEQGRPDDWYPIWSVNVEYRSRQVVCMLRPRENVKG